MEELNPDPTPKPHPNPNPYQVFREEEEEEQGSFREKKGTSLQVGGRRVRVLEVGGL